MGFLFRDRLGYVFHFSTRAGGIYEDLGPIVLSGGKEQIERYQDTMNKDTYS